MTTVRPGAESFSHDGSSVGVLLSHGFTGSPISMRPWAEHLAAAGHTVRLPRLPGHGTTWQEMNRTTWQDWYAELERAFEELAEHHFVRIRTNGHRHAVAFRGTAIADERL